MSAVKAPIKTLVDAAAAQATAPASAPAVPPAKPPPDTPIPARAAHKSEAGEGWGEPILFGSSAPTPEIRADILPGVYGEFAQALSENLQTAPALAVCYSLAVLSTALQRKFVVAPRDDGSYAEPVSVWTLLVAKSGERKSAVIERLTRPLTFWERRRLDAERATLAESESQRKIALKRAEKLEVAAAAEEDAERRAVLAKEAGELKASAPTERCATQLWTGDVTPEELQDMLVKQNGKMAVLSDEPGLFAILAGVYSGGTAVLDVFLKSYSGQDVRVNRRSRSAVIERPALTLGLAVQPGILADIAPDAKKRFRDSGLIGRFFPVYPEPRVGHRDVRKRSLIPDELQRAYDRAVIELLDIESLDGGEVCLVLDDAAHEKWMDFAEEVERALVSGGSLSTISDLGAKLAGGALRVAGLLHIAEHGQAGAGQAIDKDTMLRAICFAWLVVDHAKAVFGLVGLDKTFDDARSVWQWIEENRITGFLRSEAHKKFHCRFASVQSLIETLEVLKGRELIRGPIPVKRGTGGGRTGHAYDVNPAVIAMWKQ